MKFFSSIRVTSTEVVNPFFGKVASVVAPIARLAVVRGLPPAISAFALLGAVAMVAVDEVDGDGVLDGDALA